MFLVPNVAVLVMEVIHLETVFKNLYLELGPTKTNCVPVTFPHVCRDWSFNAANRQQITNIRYCVLF